MAKERIGIMGGTFDPIHLGHIHMAKAAIAAGQLTEVLVVPSGNPPHKHDTAPAEDRWRMVCTALAQEPQLTPSRIELDRQGVIYTIDTLSILREQYPKAEFFYIIGADTLMELCKWRRYEEVLKLCTFLVCPRAWNWTVEQLNTEKQRLRGLGGRFITVDTEPLCASSTDIREALSRGAATPALPVTVREYAQLRGLYGAPMRLREATAWLDKLFGVLTIKRFSHTLAVAHTARHLARMHGVNQVQAETAGLLHDCAKCLPLKTMQQVCAGRGLTEDVSVLCSGNLLHSVAGAYLAASEYGVEDPDVLRAISCHTTGKPEMTPLDMVVYLADKIEPTRESYPTLDKVRMLSQLSLERAMLLSMEGTTKYVKKGGKPLHPMTMETIAWLRSQPAAN